MDFIRKIKAYFSKKTAQPTEPPHPHRYHYDVDGVDGYDHVETDSVKIPDFRELEHLLLQHRDFSAKNLHVPPEEVRLISIGFIYAYRGKKDRGMERIAFATGQIYRDSDARELCDALDSVVDDYGTG